MGLQSIEIVMEVEDEFGISLPDPIAEEIRTVGGLHDAVLALVKSGGPEKLRNRPDLNEFLWGRICKLSAALSHGVKPEHITRETRFIEDLGYG